jgi:hypothetical protein
MYQESDEFTSTTALNVRKDFVWGKSRQWENAWVLALCKEDFSLLQERRNKYEEDKKKLWCISNLDIVVWDIPHKLNLIKRTYLVNTWTEKRTFEYWQNGVSIPNHRGQRSLQFENSKIQRVKSFYNALWLFLKEIEK